MRILKTTDRGFRKTIDVVTMRGMADISGVEATCRMVLEEVRRRGDRALLEYTGRFDAVHLRSAKALVVEEREMEKAVKAVPAADLRVLKRAAARITRFHKRELTKSWSIKEKDGTVLGQRVLPLQRVGIYVPGGKASYPSSVLMNAIPPKVAGVGEVYMATPPAKGGINPHILAAARIAGVTRIFRVGGAQAVAGLAYGTKTIPAVDKIVGPGNIFVATAKRLVFGIVDIDMIAGPSEVLILNDGSGSPDWIAADLLAQAEHDELASGILITTSRTMAEAVSKEVEVQLAGLKREAVARKSIERYGIIIIAGGLDEAAELANTIAPEHLEIVTRRPATIVGKIRNAGAIFVGEYTPEALGDYMAGPNHTLPTGGTARFSSPLGVNDFLKRSSLISFSRRGLEKLGRDVKRFAEMEGLEAHGRSVSLRKV